MAINSLPTIHPMLVAANPSDGGSGGSGGGDPFDIYGGGGGGFPIFGPGDTSGGGGGFPPIFTFDLGGGNFSGGGSGGGSGQPPVNVTPVSFDPTKWLSGVLGIPSINWGRIAAFLLGLILIAGGIYLIRPVQNIVNQTVKRSAKASAALAA